jgi:hypothetical protein
MHLSRRILLSCASWIALLGVLASGQSAISADSPEVHIHALDPSVDLSELAGPRVRLHPAPQASPRRGKAQRKSELPGLAERDAVLSQSGLAPALKGWDELARDQLYLRARELDFGRLKGIYPDLPVVALEKLSTALRGTQ